MIIVSSDRTEAVCYESIMTLRVAPSGLLSAKTIRPISKDASKPDVFLGKYNNEIQAGRALEYILEKIDEGQCEVIYVPGVDDHIMQGTEKPLVAGAQARQYSKRTNGKTK